MLIRERAERPSLGGYVGIALIGAAITCVVAVGGVVLTALINVLGGDIAFPPPQDLLVAMLFVFASYFAAAVVAALALWLLSPIKESFLGCVLRGAVLAPVIYGIVGFASVILYVRAGVNIIDYESPEAAWSFLRLSFPIFFVLGAVIWGPILYYQSRRHERLIRR